MAKQPDSVRTVTDALDTVGATKAFAIVVGVGITAACIISVVRPSVIDTHRLSQLKPSAFIVETSN